MNTKLLEIRTINLTKKYRNNVVLKNLNLNFSNDKINFLVSANGSGKSTLIKCILNLTKYKGKIITNCKVKSYCPEKINLPDFITIKYFLSLFNIDHQKANILLNKFNLKSDLKVSQLSKGMHQKILIIQCLCKEADAYLFDEPLNGLDLNSKLILIDEINKLYKRKKLIIISSHHIEHYKHLEINICNLSKVNDDISKTT